MPKSTDACNRILNLMYSATAWATVADNAASTPLTNVYVGLHTGLLTPANNDQHENEVNYTNYARVARARSTGFTAASGGSISNAALLQFPQSGLVGATLHTVSTGTTSGTGTTPVWHYGALNSPITIGASASITPQFLANALVITET